MSATLLTGAALFAALAISACGAAAPAAQAKSRSTFVAAPEGTPPEGIDLYSLTTGRMVRRLARDAIDPQAAEDGRVVYFLRGPTSPGGCQYSVWKVPTAAGRPQALGIRLNGVVMGISPDGRFLAYASQPGGCHPVGPTYLTTMALASHQRHVIRLSSPVESVAWSSNDRSVTVQGYGGPYGSPVVQVYRNVSSGAAAETSSHLPCPLNAPYCGQLYPEYDKQNDLFYVATVDPNPKRPCAVYSCTSQTYVLTEVHRGKASALARTSGRAGLGSWLAVNPSGTTAVYTVASGGSLHTFIWSAGNVRRAPALVSQENI